MIQEGSPLVSYGDEGAMFLRTCPICGRFVKADETILINGLGEVKMEHNATCKVHGRVTMSFLGYY